MASISEKPVSEQQEVFIPNLLTNYDETVAAMGVMEGKEWLEKQQAIVNKTLHSGVYSSEYDTSVVKAVEMAMKGRHFVIYGKGGFNRWFVEPDGTVVFSRGHAAHSDDCKKAEELGFEVK